MGLFILEFIGLYRGRNIITHKLVLTGGAHMRLIEDGEEKTSGTL